MSKVSHVFFFFFGEGKNDLNSSYYFCIALSRNMSLSDIKEKQLVLSITSDFVALSYRKQLMNHI